MYSILPTVSYTFPKSKIVVQASQSRVGGNVASCAIGEQFVAWLENY